MNRSRWYPAYVGIGSNLNGPARQVNAAFEALGNVPETHLVNVSSLYRSAPLGGIEQPEFVNAAAALLTKLTARELLAELKTIERKRGREKGALRWGPRVLDLDLLVYSARVLDEDGLTVPHAGIAERNFVLLPLCEIAPELVVPGLGRVAGLPVNEREPAIERIA